MAFGLPFMLSPFYSFPFFPITFSSAAKRLQFFEEWVENGGEVRAGVDV